MIKGVHDEARNPAAGDSNSRSFGGIMVEGHDGKNDQKEYERNQIGIVQA